MHALNDRTLSSGPGIMCSVLSVPCDLALSIVFQGNDSCKSIDDWEVL